MDSIVQDAKQQLDLQMLSKIEKFKGSIIFFYKIVYHFNLINKKVFFFFFCFLKFIY